MSGRAAGPVRRARLLLGAGQTLLESISQAMHRLGWHSGNLQLLGGPMRQAFVHTSILTPAGPRWIDYGPARPVEGPAWLVCGSATFGVGLEGGAALHCHAVLSGSAGLLGGHLPPERCVIGDAGLVAHAVSGPDAGFRVTRDPATGFDLLAPA